jgi:DNA mismatch endonuclease, patch repair protein
MRAVRRRDTAPELALRDELELLGLRFERDVAVEGSSRTRADFLFGALRVAVFVDGCFWHGCPVHATWPRANATWWREKIEGNRRRDAETDRRLTDLGWASLRIWAHESPSGAAARVAAALNRRSDVDDQGCV